MTTENVDPAGQSGGEGSANTPNQLKESVSYDTHRKLLDEKKKLQAKLEQIDADRKAAEEADLAKKGELQKLLDLEREKAKAASDQLKAFEDKERSARKLGAIVRGLGAPVDQKWYSVLGGHIDDVVLNEDGEIEPMSVTKIVENVKKEWPEMLRKPGAGMPNHAPGNGATTISHEEWKKLPLKDMKKWKPEQIT
jgi:hypothetical protein